MAYADPLDQTAPAGSDDRRFGDDTIRQHIRAIRQRLSSIFVDIDADPMVLKDATVGTTQLIDAAVSLAKLADAIVSTAKLQDGSVTQAKLANLAVGTAQLIDQAATQAKLGLLSVGTAQLIDGAVAAAKLAAGAVLPGGIGPGTFGFDGVTSTNGYQVGGAAPAGQVLKGNGVWGVFSALVAADFPDALLQKLLMQSEGWYYTNLPGTSGSFMGRYGSLTGLGDEFTHVMARAGEIREVWVRANKDKTGGNAQFIVTKNGADTTAFAQIGDPPFGVRQDVEFYGAGVVPFAAGDLITFRWITVGLVPANSMNVVAGFGFRYT